MMNPIQFWTAWVKASMEIADLMMPDVAMARKAVLRAGGQSLATVGNICTSK